MNQPRDLAEPRAGHRMPLLVSLSLSPSIKIHRECDSLRKGHSILVGQYLFIAGVFSYKKMIEMLGRVVTSPNAVFYRKKWIMED
jgi:hypothetical protein